MATTTLPLSYTGEPGKTYRAQILNLDTKKFLDPADPEGATWLPAINPEGWPLAEDVPGNADFEGRLHALIPAGDWKDGWVVKVYIFEDGKRKSIAEDITKVSISGSFSGLLLGGNLRIG